MPPLVTSPSTPALTPQSFPPPLSTSFQSPSKSSSSTAHPQKPPAWLHSSKLCTPIPLRHSDGILVHCFSDGGSHKAVEFAEAYFKQTGEKLPVRAQCLNSTPEVMHCQNYAHAIQQTLCHTKTASVLTRALCLLLGYIWVTAFLLFTGRKNNVIAKMRKRLEDEKFWERNAPRCYLYSESDAMIGWRDVHDHAQAASRTGTPVREEIFKGSAHCAHIRENEAVYWDAVVETWKLATEVREALW